MSAAILALAFIAAGEPPPPSMFIDETPQLCQVAERYSRLGRATFLDVDLGYLREPEAGALSLSLQQVTADRGRAGAGKDEVIVRFASRWPSDEPRFREDQSLVLKADGQPLPLGLEKYTPEKWPSGGFTEKIEARLKDTGAIGRLIAAQVVEGSVGRETFRLEPRKLEALKDFARYVADPSLPVKATVPSNPNATPRPDRAKIPTGHGILRLGDGTWSCRIVTELRVFEEEDDLMANPTREKFDQLKALSKKDKERRRTVSLPSGTLVSIVDRTDLPQRSRRSLRLFKVEVVEGAHRGLTGWCFSDHMVTSLQTAADRDEAEAELTWRAARGREDQKNFEGALEFYRLIVEVFPLAPMAKKAEERIKVLSRK